MTCCKEVIHTANEYLHNQFRAGVEASELIRLRAAFIDALLGTLWDHYAPGQTEVALVAVGGYGRGELHPH